MKKHEKYSLSLRNIHFSGWLMTLGCAISWASPLPIQAPACQAGELTGDQIQAVRRTPPDLPLADLSSYGPRQAPRSPSAMLHGEGCENNTLFRYGVGKGDITGPVLGQGLAAYADPGQASAGLANRQHARAFAFSSACGGSETHAMLVIAENGLMNASIVQGVMNKIATVPSLAGRYNRDNLMIQATHTHSAGGGQSYTDLYNIMTFGFDQQSYDAIVAGLVRAIQQADTALRNASPAPVYIAQGELLNGNVNRSPPAYALNPKEERAKYLDSSGREVTTNRMMVLLKLPGADGQGVGALNFYPIHGTSIAQTNKLLSGDNKGYAAWRMEREMNTARMSASPFVSGFFQSDEGDSSPNLFMMDLTQKQLRDRTEAPFTQRGGGSDDDQSTVISGYKQYAKAQALYDDAHEQLHGSIKSTSIYLDMTKIIVENPTGRTTPSSPGRKNHRTCEPAFGVTFAAGAEDGVGPFTEGAACPMSPKEVLALAGNWRPTINSVLSAVGSGAIPSELELPLGCALREIPFALSCQAEKSVLLPLSISPFTPGQALVETVVPIQVMVLGQLAIAALPWEVTTMAGRRLRLALMDALQDAGISYVVVAGLANGYSDYLTTREEYASQQYEGGSNTFGPWTLEALQQEFVRLADALRQGKKPMSPYAVPDRHLIKTTFIHHPRMDSGSLPEGAHFGDVITQPKTQYQLDPLNATLVNATFHAANPRLDLRQESSYVYVDKLSTDGSWEEVANDDSWQVKLAFTWNKGEGKDALFATVTWAIPADATTGTYRIRLEGASPNGPYVGITDSFQVIGCQPSGPQV